MSRGRNLLYVGTLPPHKGGSAVNAARILEGLVARGWTVRAIGPITRAQADAGDPFAAANPDIAVTRFQMPFDETNAYDPAGVAYRNLQTDNVHRALRMALDTQLADVVVIGRESFVWGITPIAKAYGAATVQLAQGLLLTVASGTYPSTSLGERLVAEIGQTDLVIAMAHHMAATILGMGIQPCIAIANRVDLNQFQPQPKNGTLLRRLRFDEDAIVVVHPSNLNPVKRPLDVVESAAIAVAREPRLVYVVAGEGPGQEAMKSTCKRYKISKHFRFVGWVSPSEMPNYYSIADVVTVPSQSECLALVYLEAQACARTLFASDIPAAREVITDHETGILFKTGDIDDFAEKTLMLAHDPDLRARVGRNARAAMARHTFADCIAEYEAAFESVSSH